MNNRVCIIRSNPVKPDSRVEKEAWTLVKAGYQVHVLAWDRDSNHKAEDSYITVADEKIPITRLGYKAEYGAGLRSLGPNLQFQFHMCRWLKKNQEEFDILHACDFDTAFFSQTFARKKKFVFDIFDFLYGEPKSLFQKLIYKAQIRLINRADATIICTEERKRQIKEATPKRLVVIHNTPIRSLLNENEGISFQGSPLKIKIVYVGIFSNRRLLEEMGEVISQDKRMEFHVAGFGSCQPYLEQLAESHENIFFYGRIPYEQTLALESNCDIMTAIYDPAIENHRYAAPNKFYESLMLGKPLIMAKGTGMSSVVEENNIGELIEFSKEGFRDGLQELIDKKDEWEEMSARMKNIYEEHFSWEKMKERLISLYSEISE